MELKTLKDMGYNLEGFMIVPESFDIHASMSIQFRTICKCDELRQEAINEVKRLRAGNFEPNKVEGAVEWIKHFFNLTEEDLK